MVLAVLYGIATLVLIPIASFLIAAAARIVRSESDNYSLVCAVLLGAASGFFSGAVFGNIYGAFAYGLLVFIAVYRLSLSFLRLLNKLRPQRDSNSDTVWYQSFLCQSFSMV